MMMRAISAVAAVQYTGPANPSLTSLGSRPQWSRWAWVRSTASMLEAGKSNGSQLRPLNCRS